MRPHWKMRMSLIAVCSSIRLLPSFCCDKMYSPQSAGNVRDTWHTRCMHKELLLLPLKPSLYKEISEIAYVA